MGITFFFKSSTHRVEPSRQVRVRVRDQSRPDRDEYVRIVYDNVEPGSYEQFAKRSQNESMSLGYAYDYHSVTHYGSNYFSMSIEPTIRVM